MNLNVNEIRELTAQPIRIPVYYYSVYYDICILEFPVRDIALLSRNF